jgi:hypothetical protein
MHGASERAATHTCITEMLDSTPPELAGACAVQLRHAPGAGALCPPSGSRRGRASRRPLRCRPRRRQAAKLRTHGASTVRGHIYLAQSTTVLVVVRARRTSHRWATCFIIRWTKKNKTKFCGHEQSGGRRSGRAWWRGGGGRCPGDAGCQRVSNCCGAPRTQLREGRDGALRGRRCARRLPRV